MSYSSWQYIEMMGRLKRDEFMREAENWRMVKIAGSMNQRKLIFQPILKKLGDWFTLLVSKIRPKSLAGLDGETSEARDMPVVGGKMEECYIG
jgi:hypothetical protein